MKDRSKEETEHTLVGRDRKRPIVIDWFAPVPEIQALDDGESDAAVYGQDLDNGALFQSGSVEMK